MRIENIFKNIWEDTKTALSNIQIKKSRKVNKSSCQNTDEGYKQNVKEPI